MGFTVTNSIEPWTDNGQTATRGYIVEWDGTGVSTTNTARVALVSFLATQAEHYGTGAIRDLSAPGADPLDPANERTLAYFLHGKPIQPVEVIEVEGSEESYYTSTVTWGLTADQDIAFAAAGARSEVSDDEEADLTYATSLSASVNGRTVDYLPLEYLFVANDATAASPPSPLNYPSQINIPFTLGSVNAEQSDAGGPITINGLSISAPAADLTLSYELRAGSVKAAWAEAMHRAAKRGTLNTDAMTINGISYRAGDLLLVSFDVRLGGDGRVAIDIGFATADSTAVEFTAVAGGWLGGAARYETTELDYFDREFSLVSDDAPPLVSGVRTLYISGHYYVWSFITKALTGDWLGKRDFVCVHNPWSKQAFGSGGLLGVNTL